MEEMPPSSAPDTTLTTYQVSRILQVSPQVVIRWADRGVLPSYKTAGGHRRIRREDLMTFVREHEIPVRLT